MAKMHIKKNDTVVLLSGDYADKFDKDRNRKTMKVIEVAPKEGKVIVEGVNTVSKHVKARRQGEQSAIVKVDAPIYACKVQLYCKTCGKGRRAQFITGEDGKKVRVCCKCKNEF